MYFAFKVLHFPGDLKFDRKIVDTCTVMVLKDIILNRIIDIVMISGT